VALGAFSRGLWNGDPQHEKDRTDVQEVEKEQGMRRRKASLGYCCSGLCEEPDRLPAITAPSGQQIQLTPEEEAEIVKQAMVDRIHSRLTRGIAIQRSTIEAVGSAIGFAAGGLLAAWLIGKAAHR
jgi:hypothetical protein